MLHRYASEPAALIAQHIVHIEALLEQGGFGTEVPEGLEAIDDLTSLETVLQAVRRSVGPATEVRYAEGCGLDNGDDVGMRDAIKAASGADVAIVVAGESSVVCRGRVARPPARAAWSRASVAPRPRAPAPRPQPAIVIARSGRSRNGGKCAARFENGSTSGCSAMPSASFMNLRRAWIRPQAPG